MIYGICGRTGSGKSTLAKLIKDANPETVYVDIDKIGHEVLELEEVKNELVSSFGLEVIDQGVVDRKVLGKVVFTSTTNMDILTHITWKHMDLKLKQIILDNQDKNIILDWALLPKTEYINMSDVKILVKQDVEIRKERIMKRDNITEEKFYEREQASYVYDEDMFDYIYENNILIKAKEGGRIL